VLGLDFRDHRVKVRHCFGNVFGTIIERHQRLFTSWLSCPVQKKSIWLATPALFEDVSIDTKLLVVRMNNRITVTGPTLSLEVENL
jgi:hypothetical protein